MRLLPKWIQDIAKNITANENIRPDLAGVHVSNTHVSATNSFIAIRVELPKTESSKYPGKNMELLPEGGIFISKSALAKIKFSKNNLTPILNENAVIRSIDENTISIVVDDLDTEIQYKSKLITTKMPDIKEFHKKISESPKTHSIAFSISYMQDMLATFKAMGFENMRLHTHEEQGIILTTYDYPCDSWGIIMPLKP